MELIHEAAKLVNLPYTFLLILCLLYWINVMIGVLSPDTIDFDLDGDVDVDADIDSDISDLDSDIGVFGHVAGFLYLGKVPFMLVLSFLSLLMWVLSVLGNYYLGNDSVGMALAIALPIIAVSVFLTRFFVYPFSIVFKKMNEEVDREVVGKVAKILIPASGEKKGQASVLIGNAEQKVYIKTLEKHTILTKGDEAIVVDFDEHQNCYVVEPV
ncbi:OB-fold-containig protein [Flammeovirga sp. OC4]|uniref:OB-fold-containig protein n=1 Tax=Flammeovirga sp. OC4 TaxID=1382345 RepID=UPI0012E0324C|nr:OB-fold-containig protein [Flammeovirga sp. OC4]